MAQLLRQLLVFARRRAIERSRCDARAVARQTVELLTPLAKRRGVDLACAEGPEVPVTMDGAQVQQAVTNLVVNAIQAMTAPGR